MLVTELLLALLTAQNGDVAQLIEQLGDPEPTIRESAEAKLRKIGTPALDALRKAAADLDKERAVRASALVEEFNFNLKGRIAIATGSGSGKDEIRVVDPDTGEFECVFRMKDQMEESAEYLHSQWIRGKRTLLVYSEHWSNKSDWIWFHGWTVAMPKGSPARIAEIQNEMVTSVSPHTAVAPDGSRLVLSTTDRNLDISSLDGSNRRRLKIPECTPSHAAWSGDGKTLVFELWNNGPATCVFSVDEDKATFAVREELKYPAFTPRGDFIVGMTPAEDRGMFDLARMDVSTQQVVRLFKNIRSEPPSLSPDGTRVACVRQKKDEIVLVNLDGKNETSVANGESPTWSPDGTRLAYERKGRLFVLDLKTRQEKDLGEGKRPRWSR